MQMGRVATTWGIHVQLFAVVTPSVPTIYLINFSDFGLYSKYDKVGHHDLPFGLLRAIKASIAGANQSANQKLL
jgi:hypothetical protein